MLKRYQLALWLLLITMAAYWSATRGQFLVYDDDVYVTGNSHVQGGLTVENLKWIFLNPVCGNWHPVTMLTHMLDYRLYGLKPWGHHLTNVLLHAVNTALVFVWLRGLTGAVWRSFFVAALFGWHPLHVESVAWLAERKDVLSGCFALMCLICYTGYVRKSEAGGDKSAISWLRSPYYWLTFFCFTLGLMSKPMLVTWPFVLLLLDYWPFRRISQWKQSLVEKTPFFLLVVFSCAVTFVAQKQGGAVVGVQDLTLEMRSENALISYCRYLGKLFWPTSLAAFYPLPDHWSVMQVLLAVVLLVGLSVLLVRCRRQHPYLLMGWLWYVGTLVPVIGLVQAGRQSMADRYTYLPSLGFLILVVWGASELTRRWRHQVLVLSLVGSVVIISCVALTRQQIGYWQNAETLFRYAIKVTKDNYFGYRMVGDELQSKGHLDEAIVSYQEAIRLKPYFFAAEYNLGHAYEAKGRLEEAFKCYLQAVKWQPNFFQAYNNLGNIRVANGRCDEAIPYYRQALSYKPDYPEAHSNLGIALLNKGRVDEAIGEFQQAVRLKPDYARAHKYLGFALLDKGKAEAAVNELQQAIRQNPNDSESHYDLGVAFGKKDRSEEAVEQYKEAIRLNADNLLAHNNLGNALFRQGRREEAIVQYRESIRLKPDYAEAHNNLGYVLLENKQIEESISEFQEALRLKPDYAAAKQNLRRALQIRNAPVQP